VMFCTGGIRCEPASAMFLSAGFDKENLYQLEGGIVKYAEKYGNDGFYEGKCFVFDDRLALLVNTQDGGTSVGECLNCGTSTDLHRNCMNKFCNRLFLSCDACYEKFQNTCSQPCSEMALNPANLRPPRLSKDILHRNK